MVYHMNDNLSIGENNLHAGTSGTKRKNKPEELKHGLIMAAKHLMVSDGVANLSMQKLRTLQVPVKADYFIILKIKKSC